jgi:hypothetical protein
MNSLLSRPRCCSQGTVVVDLAKVQHRIRDNLTGAIEESAESFNVPSVGGGTLESSML